MQSSWQVYRSVIHCEEKTLFHVLIPLKINWCQSTTITNIRSVIQQCDYIPLPKTLTLFMTKICDFPTVFMTRPKIWYPIYDCCGWHSCPKYNFWKVFVYGVIDNDKYVASSKNIANSRLEYKNHTLFKTKMAKLIPYLWQKRLKNHTLWGHTYLYSPYKGVLAPQQNFAGTTNKQLDEDTRQRNLNKVNI